MMVGVGVGERVWHPIDCKGSSICPFLTFENAGQPTTFLNTANYRQPSFIFIIYYLLFIYTSMPDPTAYPGWRPSEPSATRTVEKGILSSTGDAAGSAGPIGSGSHSEIWCTKLSVWSEPALWPM